MNLLKDTSLNKSPKRKAVELSFWKDNKGRVVWTILLECGHVKLHEPDSSHLMKEYTRPDGKLKIVRSCVKCKLGLDPDFYDLKKDDVKLIFKKQAKKYMEWLEHNPRLAILAE